MNVVIIDDENAARSELRYLIEKYFESCEIIEFTSGQSIVEYTDKMNIDVAFIDIHLGDIDGLSIAKLLKQINENILVIFVSAYEEYALKSYDIGVLDYLTKPLLEPRFEILVSRIKKMVESNQRILSNYLSVTNNKKIYFIPIESIIYIELFNRKTKIITLEQEYESNDSLLELEQKLNNQTFFRSHKSYLINTKYLISLECYSTNQYEVSLRGLKNIKIPVSRSRITEFKKLISYK